MHNAACENIFPHHLHFPSRTFPTSPPPSSLPGFFQSSKCLPCPLPGSLGFSSFLCSVCTIRDHPGPRFPHLVFCPQHARGGGAVKLSKCAGER